MKTTKYEILIAGVITRCTCVVERDSPWWQVWGVVALGVVAGIYTDVIAVQWW